MTPPLLLLLRRPGLVVSLLVHGAVVATAFLAVVPTPPSPAASFAGTASFDAVPLEAAAASLAAPQAPDVVPAEPNLEPPESMEPRTAEEVVVEAPPEPVDEPDDAVIRVAADVAARPLPVARRLPVASQGAPAGSAGPVGPAVVAPAGNGRAALSLAGGPTGDAKPWSSNRKPVYPEAERLRGIEGVVLLRFVVHPDGSVEVSLERSSGSDALDRAALEAAGAWRYSPALVDGVPTTDTFVREIRFHLH